MIFEQWLASPWLESARLAFRCEERDLFASTVSMFVDQRNEVSGIRSEPNGPNLVAPNPSTWGNLLDSMKQILQRGNAVVCVLHWNVYRFVFPISHFWFHFWKPSGLFVNPNAGDPQQHLHGCQPFNPRSYVRACAWVWHRSLNGHGAGAGQQWWQLTSSQMVVNPPQLCL